MTDMEAVWLAAIVDGEGCLCVKLHDGGRPVLVLDVRNTDKAIIERCYALAGCGSLWWNEPTAPQRKAVATWQASGQAAQDVIRRISPYLVGVERRRRAELALQFPCYPLGWNRLSEEARAERQRIPREFRNV